LLSGTPAFSIVPGTTNTSTFTTATLTRGVDRPLLFVRGNNLGNASGSQVGQFIATNLASLPAADFIGTGSATNLTNTQAPILRWAVGTTVAGAYNFTDFL